MTTKTNSGSVKSTHNTNFKFILGTYITSYWQNYTHFAHLSHYWDCPYKNAQ